MPIKDIFILDHAIGECGALVVEHRTSNRTSNREFLGLISTCSAVLCS